MSHPFRLFSPFADGSHGGAAHARLSLLLVLGMVIVLGSTSEAAETDQQRESASAATQSESSAEKTSESGSTTPPERQVRWYKEDSVDRGKAIYAQNCAVCHGEGGEGSFSWRKRGEDGKFPPPPLNGTGHAWHHPFRILGYQIKSGTPGGQGSMPAFGDRLSDQQIVDVIAWFQDLWPDEIYDQWWQIELRSRK